EAKGLKRTPSHVRKRVSVRWRRVGAWSRIMDAPAAAHEADVQVIDTPIVRLHQHATRSAPNKSQFVDRSRASLSTPTAYRSGFGHFFASSRARWLARFLPFLVNHACGFAE